MQMADIKLLHIPYKSKPLAVTDLFGGTLAPVVAEIYTATPAELGTFQPAESQKWARIIETAGITPE